MSDVPWLNSCRDEFDVTDISVQLVAGVRRFPAQCSATPYQHETVASGQPREKIRIESTIVLSLDRNCPGTERYLSAGARERNKELSKEERKAIGDDLRTMQFGWPVGMPLVRKMENGLWEIRTDFFKRIARVLFTVVAGEAVLLHGFIKQSRKTPQPDLKTARKRKALLK